MPFKTCTYDCIYCQLGRTRNRTVQREAWVPVQQVLAELKTRLACRPDYITISGSGEPTLSSELEALIHGIKEMTDIPVAVLTNGSLLWQPAVRKALICADLVVPSLDAGSDRIFQYVNRPHPDVTFSKLLEGLAQFRDQYAGQYWLEVFLIAGVTTPATEVEALASWIKTIRPDKVQINTVTRPPAEDFAEGVGQSRLQRLAPKLHAQAEVIADRQPIAKPAETTMCCDAVLTLLLRRPCSIEEIAAGLGLHPHEAIKYVEALLAQGKIERKLQQGRIFFSAVMPLQTDA